MAFSPIITNLTTRARLTRRHYWQLFSVDAKQYSRFYDAAKRIVKAGNLPAKVTLHGQRFRVHEALAHLLSEAVREGRLEISGASFAGHAQEIVSHVKRVLASIHSNINTNNITVESLSNKRLIIENLTTKPQKMLAKYYDTTSPLQRIRAFGDLLGMEISRLEQTVNVEAISAENTDLRKLNTKLNKGLWEVMKSMMLSSGRILDNFLQQVNSIYQNIAVHILEGMELGDNCESLIFRVEGPNGETNVPLMYTQVDKKSSLKDSQIKKLKAKGLEKESDSIDLALPSSMTIDRVDRDGNKYWTIREYDDFTPRRDYVVVVEKNGSKILYKKTIRHGNDLLKRYSNFKMEKLFRDQPNAYVELRETTFKDEGLADGDIIPTILHGTKLVAASHAGKDLLETKDKVDSARKIQEEIFENTASNNQPGIVIPLYEHPAEYSFGLIGEAFVKPFKYFIENGTLMVNSKKPLLIINEAMRKAAAGVISVLTGGKFGSGKIPETFYVGSGNRINNKREYCISTVVEVPAPEVTLESIDHQKVIARFQNGLIYTNLSALAEGMLSGDKRAQDLMRLLIPSFLLEPLERGDLEVLRGKFRDISIGFIDLKSSTAICQAFADKGAAQDYNTLISRLMTKLKEEVEALGLDVALLKYLGDCIMFATGIPYETGNDYGNIIRANIAMKKAVLKSNHDPVIQEIYKRHEKDIFSGKENIPTSAQFCSGIASGVVFAGDILAKDKIDHRAVLTGSWFVDQQMVYDVSGPAANLAARHESAAGAWHILINMKTIEGAKREGSLDKIIKDFNAYCLDYNAIRDNLLIPYYQNNGIDYNLADLNRKLKAYTKKFKPLTFDDLSTQTVSQGKGTGIERTVYFRWDSRPIVLERLKQAGITIPKINRETDPPTIPEILINAYSTEFPDQDTISRLKEYGNFVGFKILKAITGTIKDKKIRDNILNNLKIAERDVPLTEMERATAQVQRLKRDLERARRVLADIEAQAD